MLYQLFCFVLLATECLAQKGPGKAAPAVLGDPQQTAILSFFSKFEASDFDGASRFFAPNPEYQSNGVPYVMDLSNPATLKLITQGRRTAIEFARKDNLEVWVNCIFTDSRGCAARENIEIAFNPSGLIIEFSHIKACTSCSNS